MSITTRIQSITQHIADAYDECEDQGATIPQNKNLENLADCISTINGEQPEPTPIQPLDPEQVYADERPSDWLELPEPQEEEAYALFLFPHEGGLYRDRLLAFSCSITSNKTNSYVNFELGTIENGVFVRNQNYPVKTITHNGIADFAVNQGDFGNITSDGMEQAVIHISWASENYKPLRYSIVRHPDYSQIFTSYNIVDIKLNLTVATSANQLATSKTVYISYELPLVTTLNRAFSNKSSLQAIVKLETGTLISLQQAFQDCSSLKALPELDCGKVPNADSAFAKCTNLEALDLSNSVEIGSCLSIFSGCNKLQNLVLPNITGTSLGNTFYGCTSLIFLTLGTLNNVKTMSGTFRDCSKLSNIQLDLPELQSISTNAFLNVTADVTITAPNLVSIGGVPAQNSGFYGYKGKNVSLLNSTLTGTCQYAFASADKLRTLNINATPNISSYMFQNCSDLQQINGTISTAESTNCNSMYDGCSKLNDITIDSLDEATNVNNMLKNCMLLTNISIPNMPLVTTSYGMLQGCKNLTSVTIGQMPLCSTPCGNNTDQNGMFQNCENLRNVVLPDLPSAISLRVMFNGNNRLKSVSIGDVHSVNQSFSNTFTGCYDLEELTFKNNQPSWTGQNINISDTNIHHNELVEMFNSLPTITANKAITLTNLPEITELTNEEKAIATSKGWTLTI